MFNPSEKINQHYVPQFWQKRFADPSNVLFALIDGKIKKTSTKKLMSGNWIYTTFNNKWIPSNHLEDLAGGIEGHASQIMTSLDIVGSTGSLDEQLFIRDFIAFSACRHPDVMNSVQRRVSKLAYAMADVHSKSLLEFQEIMQTSFGMTANDALTDYETLKLVPENVLLQEAEDIEQLSPNNPLLPAQITVEKETIDAVTTKLANHKITIIDAPLGQHYILGDTPFAIDLGQGFIIPLSSTMALLWEQDTRGKFPPWSRREATLREISDSNDTQANNSLKVIIGPTKNVLVKYAVSSL